MGILVGGILYLGTPQDRDYPPEVRRGFTTGCRSVGAPPEYCSCLLEAIEDELTLEQWMVYERRAQETGEIPPSVVAIGRECR